MQSMRRVLEFEDAFMETLIKVPTKIPDRRYTELYESPELNFIGRPFEDMARFHTANPAFLNARAKGRVLWISYLASQQPPWRADSSEDSEFELPSSDPCSNNVTDCEARQQKRSERDTTAHAENRCACSFDYPLD